ncbi:hypothetical protein HGRIS_004150 [Hohenbuehelia grisea]|uniref:TRIP4/RQT4 C2HC5-type zinc finger domain-containing protein n=1 Tax=Hohenbuehelia grisea TaxID=104357 RepID=A0ABR3JIL9_9AGAR
MHKTAWTSLPSDRIKPTHKPPAQSSDSKGKGKAKASNEPPKSSEVKRLEALADAVRRYKGTEVDSQGGCFCQAREHALSTYTPICLSCGLILCSINLPHHKCPSCLSALLDPALREAITARLEASIADTLAHEAAARARAQEEQRRAVGDFPSLGGPTAPGVPSSADSALRPPPQAHKVLSLNSKTKRVVISSYTPSPTPSRPPSRSDAKEEVQTRVNRPPNEVAYSREPLQPARPWANVVGDAIVYRPPVKDAKPKGEGKRRRKQNRPAESAS